jgi:hypothetical protein
LIECVDTLVTGLTSLDVQTLPIYRPNLITPEDLPVLQRAGVVGDLALHLVVASDDPDTPDQAPPSPERELVAHVKNLIVGATPQDFIRVAERVRHGSSDGLGVIVLAVGAWKAPILTTAVRMRAVNELITDLETAMAICRHVNLTLPEKHRQAAAIRA